MKKYEGFKYDTIMLILWSLLGTIAIFNDHTGLAAFDFFFVGANFKRILILSSITQPKEEQ